MANIPLLNSSGFSDISQCPASTSTSRKRGKNWPMSGMASSGTYVLLVPLTNSVGFTKRTSSGLLKGKSPMWSSDLVSVARGTRNRRVFSPGCW